MQLSDLKDAYAAYLIENNGKIPSACKMGALLFDELKSFVDPIIDESEKYSIPVKPRRYFWRNVDVIRDDETKPYKFRFE